VGWLIDDGLLCSCVLTAVIGMATVVWYAWTGKLSEEEIEDEVRKKVETKKVPFWKRS
jgi:iron transport multicopper oxidase